MSVFNDLFNDVINGMINNKNFNPRLLEICKLSFKGVVSVNTNYIKYVTMKSLDHVNINIENFLNLIFYNVDEYIEENNGIKYLVLT